MGKLKESIMWPNACDYTPQWNQKLSDSYFKHHDIYNHNPPQNKYNIVGDRVEECRTVVVHSFSIFDVDDPDLQIAKPMIDWEKSEKGQWIMKNAVDTPTWHRMADPMTYGYKYQIRAKLMGPALTEWLLRYGR